MPTWGEMLVELASIEKSMHGKPANNVSPHDVLRRKYLAALGGHTGRSVIAYGTAWMENKPQVAGSALSVNLSDLHGFMETCSNLTSRQLDLIISSPGGSADAAESIMDYLRTQFDDIRVIVPVAAMSAATMMALASDQIVMGNHSQLGPIDPQFTIQTPDGPRTAPGQAILDQFELAKEECQDPRNLAAWLPMLRGLMPGLLAQCTYGRDLAEEFARKSLAAHMFAGEPEAATKAQTAAAWFSDFTAFRSHGRRVSREDARSVGIKVLDLESDKILQDLVLSVYHAMRVTFAGTGTTKLIENDKGRAYIEQMQTIVVQQPAGTPALASRTPPGSADSFGQPQNRQQRRHPSR